MTRFILGLKNLKFQLWTEQNFAQPNIEKQEFQTFFKKLQVVEKNFFYLTN